MHRWVFIGIITVLLFLVGAMIFVFGREMYTAESPVDVVATSTPDKKAPTLLFVGDMMLGRRVETLMREHGDQYPFEHVRELFTSYDAVVANLEGPLLKDHVQTPELSVRFNFRPEVASVLAGQNISIAMLGNNHTHDYGEAGYQETRTYLEEAGVQAVGHPFSLGEQYALHTEIAGRRFTFISYNATNPNFNYANAALEVASVREKDLNAVLVVNVHWGEEYILTSGKRQQDFAHAVVDAGADLVIGHHPHVTQEVEVYNGVAIFYSLGNFIFDQYFSKDVEQGLAVGVSVENNTLRLQIIPIQSSKSQPAVMRGNIKTEWLQGLADRSDSALRDAIEQGVLVTELSR